VFDPRAQHVRIEGIKLKAAVSVIAQEPAIAGIGSVMRNRLSGKSLEL
jgi:hypothetical protein